MVIDYDRRGRGESADTAPYAVEREVEDLAALINQAGGRAAVYGHSSGAGLALEAAARGSPITRFVLHYPPYADDEESQRSARELGENVRVSLAEDRHTDAIKLFFADMGMPGEMLEGMARDPNVQALAPTMPYDLEVMGDLSRGGAIPEDSVRAIKVPTLITPAGPVPSSSGTPPSGWLSSYPAGGKRW